MKKIDNQVASMLLKFSIYENVLTAPCAACCCKWSEVTTQTLGQPSSFKAET